jgi:hypothetical protein
MGREIQHRLKRIALPHIHFRHLPVTRRNATRKLYLLEFCLANIFHKALSLRRLHREIFSDPIIP